MPLRLEQIVRMTTDGTYRVKTLHAKRTFSLVFQHISSTQLSALEAAAVYSGTVEFWPEGSTGDHYTGGIFSETECVLTRTDEYNATFVYTGTLDT